MNDGLDIVDGEMVAKLFRYYRRMQNPHYTGVIPLKLVSGKTLYNKYKDKFDKFVELANKNHFDINPYIKYSVINRGINERCIDAWLSSTTLLKEFYNYIAKKAKLDKIYNKFMESVKSIVDECIEIHTYTTKDFLRELIDSNRIGAYVLAGKISLHYLAAIPGFPKIIGYLDYFSKLELQSLIDHFEIYHSEINEAFLEKTHKMVNPIELTDLAILRKMKKL